MRTDFEALVIVAPSQGGKATVARMCDLPGFVSAIYPDTTRVQPGECDNYDKIMKRWKAIRRRVKLSNPRDKLNNPIPPKKRLKRTRSGQFKDESQNITDPATPTTTSTVTFVERIKRHKTTMGIPDYMTPTQVAEGLMREIFRNLGHLDNDDVMRELGKATQARKT